MPGYLAPGRENAFLMAGTSGEPAMRTMTTLRPLPRAGAVRERGAMVALVAFYGALALIAAIAFGTPSIHPF